MREEYDMVAQAEHKNIHEAIVAVMDEVPYVQKTDRNANQGYSFAGEGSLIGALHPAMVKHGVTACTTDVQPVKMEATTTSRDKPAHHAIAIYSVTFTHAASDTSVTVKALGESIDTQDKACAQCATIAYKYALRHCFCIQTGDDPDKRDPGGNGDQGGNGKQEPTDPGIKCPKCGKPMKVRDGKNGMFLACTGYPDCKHTQNIPQTGGEDDALDRAKHDLSAAYKGALAEHNRTSKKPIVAPKADKRQEILLTLLNLVSKDSDGASKVDICHQAIDLLQGKVEGVEVDLSSGELTMTEPATT